MVGVDEVAGKALDGCFIGACTTAEEDLILAALVLEQALDAGYGAFVPVRVRFPCASLCCCALVSMESGAFEVSISAAHVGANVCSCPRRPGPYQVSVSTARAYPAPQMYANSVLG